jgi:CheY-like chemotaxis protein
VTVPYTLLLADDSVTIQRVIELTFADEDVTVIAVSDGDQAIERLEASPPDIVLADIGMPGKNGYEVAQYIRRSPKLAHIPVVLLTGAFEPVDQARANDAGCDGVLAKPFEPQLVIGRVKELLARSHRGPDAKAPDAAGGSALAPPPTSTPAAVSIWEQPLAEQRLVTPFVEPSLAEAPASPVARGELNDYFDRLDAAFSTLASNAPLPSPAPAAPIGDSFASPAISDIDWFGTTAAATPAEIPGSEPWDVPAPPAEDAPSDLSMAYTAPSEEITAPEPELEMAPIAAPDERLAPIEESAPVEPIVEMSPPAPVAATEPAPPASAAVAEPAPLATPALTLPLPHPPPLPTLPEAFAALLAAEQGEAATPTGALWPAAAPPAPAVVTDEMLEDVTRRVLARLSDTVVRDAVADIASKVAERLVRDEIERIKASIK